jgi:hypothetical protein
MPLKRRKDKPSKLPISNNYVIPLIYWTIFGVYLQLKTQRSYKVMDYLYAHDDYKTLPDTLFRLPEEGL